MILKESFKKWPVYFSSPDTRNLGLGLILYIVLFILIYLSFYFFGFIHKLPDATNIIIWDASWYNEISIKGYQYHWYMQSNSAFFPLFPYTWKILHLNSLSVSFLNFIIFLAGLLILKKTFDISSEKILLFISLPTGIFFLVPYSESFFFLFCSIFLSGLHQKNNRMIFTGIFLASLTRATAMFFIPSIIVMELLNSRGFISKEAIRNIFLYTTAAILGLLLVVLFQKIITYEWFPFAKQQMRYWNHNFTLPGFPLISHGGEKSLWIEGFAFFTGISATFILLCFLTRKWFFESDHKLMPHRAFWFSCTYMLMLTVYCLFFNKKCLDEQTSIDSINRYIFSTAFFFMFLNTTLSQFPVNFKRLIIFASLLLLSMMLLGLGKPLVFLKNGHQLLSSYTFFICLALYISLHYFVSNMRFRPYLIFSVFTLNILLSVYLLNNFINGAWAG